MRRLCYALMTLFVLGAAPPAAAWSVSDSVKAFTDTDNPWGMAISPDGSRMAVSVLVDEAQRGVDLMVRKQRVAIHDARDGRLLRVVGPDYTSIGPFAFSGDGRRLITVRYCLSEAECITPVADRSLTRRSFVETDLDSGAEELLHQTTVNYVKSVAYDAERPGSFIFAGNEDQDREHRNVIVAVDRPAGSASRETVLHGWRSGEGMIWRLLGGSAAGRILFNGQSADDTIPGLVAELQALPPVGALGVLRLFAWDAPRQDAPARVTALPLRLPEAPQWRVALPLAATPDGRRLLVAAPVPGKAVLASGPGYGSYGLATELFLLEGRQARQLTRLCGLVLQAALSADGRQATAIMGAAVTRDRRRTPVVVYAVEVDAAAAAGGIRPAPSGIIARQSGGDAARVAARQQEAACAETWPDPPEGRITAAEVMQRVASVAARRSIADQDFVLETLKLRGTPSRYASQGETRLTLQGDDLAHGDAGHAYPLSELSAWRFAADREPLRELTLGLAMTGPCVTTGDVARALGGNHHDRRSHVGLSLLHHGHRGPVGRGRSEVDQMVYDLGTPSSHFDVSVVFGEERCAEKIVIKQSGRIRFPALEGTEARLCQAAPTIRCLGNLAVQAASGPNATRQLEIARHLTAIGRAQAARAIVAPLPQGVANDAMRDIAMVELLAAARSTPDAAPSWDALEAAVAASADPAAERLGAYARLAEDLLGGQSVAPLPFTFGGPLAASLRAPAPQPPHPVLDALFRHWRDRAEALPIGMADGASFSRGNALTALAGRLARYGDLAQAREVMAAAIASGSATPRNLAEAWAELGAVEETLEAYKPLPYNTYDGLDTLTKAMRRQGQPAAALEPIYQRMIALQPHQAPRLITELVRIGDLHHASAMARAAGEAALTLPRVQQAWRLAAVASAWMEIGDRAEAQRLLALALNSLGAVPRPVPPLAVQLYRLGDRAAFEGLVATFDSIGVNEVWRALLDAPDVEADMTFVERGAMGDGPWNRDLLLDALGVRRLVEGRNAEARSIAAELAARGMQRLASLAADTDDEGARRVLFTAARVATVAGDPALAEAILQDLARHSFKGPNAPVQLAEIAAFWSRLSEGTLR